MPLAELYPSYQREGIGEALENVANTLKRTQLIQLWGGSVNRTEKDDEKYK